MTDTIDITIVKGATFKASWFVKDINGSPIPLAGYSAKMQIRKQEKFDKKDSSGKWLRSWNETIGKGVYHTHFTLSGSRWVELLKRCNPQSKNNQRFPRYNGCTNGFRDFQEFVEWSRHEVGYLLTNLVAGKDQMWHLEKDILVKDNKVYSPQHCLFVPQEVNAVFALSCKTRGEYPIGVSFNKKSSILEVYARTQNGREYLGRSHDAKYLHSLWQKAKIAHIRRLADKYAFHKRLYDALNSRADDIQVDVDNNRESVFV